MGKTRNTYRVLVRKPEGKRPHGRPGHRQKDNVTPGITAIGWEGTDCIYLTQDRNRWKPVVNMVMNICVLLMQGTSCPVFSWKLKTVKASSYIQVERYMTLNTLTHTTYEVQRMVWFSTYHSQ